MEPMQPDRPLTITLQAQQWNGVLAALYDAPFRLAAPLIQSITQQVAAQQSQAAPLAAKPNGADEHAPN